VGGQQLEGIDHTMSHIGLIDTTLRDGNQSLWATRMTTDTMLPILPTMDRAGFHSLEMMATVNMDVCVRFLGENPWDRIRMIRRQVQQTPLRMMGMALFFSISRVYPDEVVELFNASCARAGIEHMWITAAMNDVRTAEVGIRSAREAGCRTEGAIQFTVSPVHTDEFFAQATRDFVALGIDALIVKDAGGLLTPERAATLFPTLKAVTGDIPIYCHSHCITGLGPAANLAAVQHGASAVWTATTPLANGPSLPADSATARSPQRLVGRGVVSGRSPSTTRATMCTRCREACWPTSRCSLSRWAWVTGWTRCWRRCRR
jgi:oxaloacetate decarboxylase alpha subunit